jgi:hypothetical protein
LHARSAIIVPPAIPAVLREKTASYKYFFAACQRTLDLASAVLQQRGAIVWLIRPADKKPPGVNPKTGD